MILIKNANIVNEGGIAQGDVLVDGEVIAAVGTDLKADGAEVIDASGRYLLPGVIDTHVHFRDAGNMENPAANFEGESLMALAGGVTSVVDMPNTNPQTVSLALMEEKERHAAECSYVNYGFMIGATNDNIDDILAIDPTRYAAIKLFLGSSTGNMLVNDPEKLDKLFAESKKLIVAHCEEEDIVQANTRALKMEFAGTTRENANLHPKVRTTEACYVSTYKAIARARRYNTRFHVAHVSSATELDLLSNQELDQKNVTAEVTPNHLWFDDRDYDTLGNLIKCNPAIKSNNDRLALWAALYDGRLDTIGSDHAPHPWANKQKNYFDAPSGIPSIRYSLLMMLEPFFNSCTTPSEREELIKNWFPIVVSKMCHNPAEIFGIEKRGYVRPGYQADLVLVGACPDGDPVPDNPALDCADAAARWTPLAGHRFHSQVEKVLVNGNVAYDHERPEQPVRNAQQMRYTK